MYRRVTFCCLMVLLSLAWVSQLWAAPVEIYYGTWRGDAEKEAIARFEAKNPDIKIVKSDIPYDQYVSKLSLASAGDVAYDVVRIDHNHTELMGLGVLENLNPYLTRDKMSLDDYLKPNVDLYSLGGKQSAIPISSNAEVLGYNEDHLNAVGLALPADLYKAGKWTRDTFYTIAKKLTQDINGDGKIDRWGFSTPVSWIYYMFINMAGGGVFSADGKSLRINSPETLDGVSFVYDMLHVSRVYDPNPQWDSFMSAPDKVAMSTFYGWSVGMALQQKLNFDIVPWPVYKKEQFVGASGDAIAMMAVSKKKEAAWRFVRFMVSPEALEPQVKAGTIMPVHRALALSDVFLTPGVRPYNKRAFIDTVAKHSLVVPRHPLDKEVGKIYDGELSKVWTNEQSPQSALLKAQTTAQPILDRWLAEKK